MKNYLSMLSFFIVVLNFCQAQDTIKRNVPLLNECPEIDSLVSSVINVPKYLRAPKNDSCILIRLFKSYDAGFMMGLHAIDHKKIISVLGDFNGDKSLGYFEFNKYLIFVYGDSSMNKFCTYTKSEREFTFVKPNARDALPLIRNYMGWAIFYNHGKFSYGVH